MKKLLSVLVLLTVGAVLAPAHAQILRPGETVTLPGTNAGLVVKQLAPKPELVSNVVAMPGPPDPVPGPIAFGSALIPSRGSAIVHATGGSFASPRQQADREIQKLIRKLH